MGATIDIWHCDALGAYSDAQDPLFGNTKGKKFLRGYQLTNAEGAAQFMTIYPGWYQGRTVHVHFKIRTAPTNGLRQEFTSQLYFEDALTDRVHAQAPYASKGPRPVKNAADGIFRSGGKHLLLHPAQEGQGSAATFNVALQMS
jgi:protocatechuate 3,4-dioxygenase beta subunit